ncbi:GNAT family N-acetyltransferase [Pseudoalteromonas ruthenica]|uniref:GNAT family N-acetyltransferase n=1 Tax=Pseudoalteromonas ruthenica TaxID=151081 RepID=UPI001109A696|nr:GNAT family N-acetyltransferase [Pseudoalteromonas ruthenica]TLX49638.1 GNAT family N-acetyltransferase [Pseudoalteromonas ruthenica]
MTLLIDTPRLQMRHFRLADAEAVRAFNANTEVTRYTGDPAQISTSEQARRLIKDVWLHEYERYGYARYALIHKQHNRLIGFCGFKFNPQQQLADLGYRMLPQYWQQGLGYEAAQSVMTYGLNTLALPGIYAEVDSANTSSVRILQKLGFTHTDSYRQWGLNLQRYDYMCAPYSR